jgi:hypothetical protein
LFDKLWMHFMRRSGVLPAAAMQNDFGLSPNIHHLLDPSVSTSQSGCVFELMLQATFAVGAHRVVAGFINFITATDPTTLLGVGFFCDSTDSLWHCFVSDCPTGVAPVTMRRDTATTVTCALPHRMKFIIDGSTHTVTWFIDGTQVDTWTAAAALDRTAAAANVTGTETMVMSFSPANGDITVRSHAGAIPLVRQVWATTGTPAPAAGGGGMWVSVA